MVSITVPVGTLRQVDRIRGTVTGRNFPLSLTKDYVSTWGMVQAVRELIQNALDSQSPFVYSWTMEEGGWTLSLNSELTVLSPQTLLLGSTTKRTDEDTIGSFGEGYKLALLVLTREDIPVDVLNGEVLWRPAFRYNRSFDTEILYIEEYFMSEKGNKGLTFLVRELSDQDREAIEASCLRMQKDVGQIKETEWGTILMEKPGLLYVGGLLVNQDTKLTYGYNILPRYISLERDRQTVNTFELTWITTKMWLEIGEKEPDFVAEMIHKDLKDVSQAEYGAPELVKEACYRIFRMNHPTGILASSPEEAQKSLKDGLIEKVYVGGGSYSSLVGSSTGYKTYATSAPKPPDPAQPWSRLMSFKTAHGQGKGKEKHMTDDAIRALDGLIEESKRWRLV